MLQKFRQNLAKFEFATFKKLIFLKEKAHFKGSRLAANDQHILKVDKWAKSDAPKVLSKFGQI